MNITANEVDSVVEKAIKILSDKEFFLSNGNIKYLDEMYGRAFGMIGTLRFLELIQDEKLEELDKKIAEQFEAILKESVR